MRLSRIASVSGAIFLMASGVTTSAQEAPLTPSATQPSPSTVLVRQQSRLYYGQSGLMQFSTPVAASVGIAPRHSLSLWTSANFSPSAPSGLSDTSLGWKWRIYNSDTGPIDTSRTAIISGVQVPSGTPGWSTGSFNPYIGIAHTKIVGRLGLGLALEYKQNTGSGAPNDITGLDGSDPATLLSSSALWRVSPAQYSASTLGAWYAGLEAAAIYSGGGTSLRVGPSVMYESSSWVLELGWQLYPLNTGSMAPVGGMVVAGLRWFF